VVYTLYTMRRKQIYLDERQVAQLKAAAKTSFRSVSEIIRDAIDEKLARVGEGDDFDRALTAAAGIWAKRADIGPTDEYVRRLRKDRRGARTS
jgi:Arc/MetJ-type ribon-helix-helix transcriptional regulator